MKRKKKELLTLPYFTNMTTSKHHILKKCYIKSRAQMWFKSCMQTSLPTIIRKGLF